jgi:hypothetical protein
MGKTYLTLTVGHSTFGFTSEGYKNNIDDVGISFDAMFRYYFLSLITEDIFKMNL